MVNPRRLALALAAVAALLCACGGDDEPGFSPSGSGDDAATPQASSDEPDASENACKPDVAAMLPEGFDPQSCWTAPNASDPVLVDETLFALVADPLAAEDGGKSTPVLVALDASDGSRIWTSDPLPGDVSQMAATEVDGQPGVAVLVAEHDQGDAVTEASQAWGYLAWPADVDEDTPTEAPVHITAPAEDTSFAEVRWTDQGVLAADQLLRPGATAFAQVDIDPDPILVGDYDLDETFAGVSGDMMLSYVSGVAWTEGGSEDGDSYLGWVARTTDGTQAWDSVTSSANQGENAIFAEGPARLPVVVGDYALTIIPTDETYAEYQLEWIEAATGQPAAPTPEDLVGHTPIGGSADVMAGEVGTLLSPDGKHLFVNWSTLALVIDIDAGTVSWVDSDFEISGTSIDDTTVYGSTENGNITIDLETAAATAVDPPRESLDAVAGDYGAFSASDDSGSGTEYLVVARRAG